MTATQRAMVDFASVLTTLNELEPGQTVAETTIYLALECDTKRWEIVRHLLEKLNLINTQGHRICLNDAGRAKANEIESAMKARGVSL